MDNKEHDEHKNFPTKENNFISLKQHPFFVYNCLSYKKKEREVRLKRCLKKREVVMAVTTSLCECVFTNIFFTWMGICGENLRNT